MGRGWGFDEKWVEDNRDRIVDGGGEAESDDPPTTKGKVRARGERPVERMNKTEKRYARRLDADESVAVWWYESFGFRLGKGTFYYPDFLLIRDDGRVEVHEIKGGYIRQKGQNKFRIAAEKYPWFRWELWQQESARAAWERLEKY